MAECLKYTCDSCGFSLEAWDEGNPYIEYPAGNRQHFYHPEEDYEIRRIAESILSREPTSEDCERILREYAGNEPDHICYDCQTVFRLDPDKDALVCKQCGSGRNEKIYGISGKKCVKCDGTFSEGEFLAIS